MTQESFTILVAAGCASCAGATTETARFAASAGVTFAIVDVAAPEWVPPLGFVGTPMVYLGDTVVAYGTPTRHQLSAALTREAGDDDQRRP